MFDVLSKSILKQAYFGNTTGDYLAALGILAACLAVLFTAKKILLGRLEARAAAQGRPVDGLAAVLRDALAPLILVGSVLLALRGLVLHQTVDKVLSLLWIGLLTLFGVRLALAVLALVLRDRWAAGRPAKLQALQAVFPFLTVLLWTVGLVFFLDNAGVKISAIVAGLGIGGIAVALAAQAVLADLFSYIAILFDRPFAIGDFIVVDGLMGTVEGIGIKTTRVRSLSGELLIFPNSSLTSSRIRNHQSMPRRRVALEFGVAYETPAEKLRALPELLKRIIEEIPGTAFDRAHFAKLGESSLDFEAIYFLMTDDYNRFMDAQQAVNFRLKEELDARGVAFAYPTRVIHMVPSKP